MTLYEMIYCDNCGATILFDEQTSMDVWGCGHGNARDVSKIRNIIECCDQRWRWNRRWSHEVVRMDETYSGLKIGDKFRLFNIAKGTWDYYVLIDSHLFGMGASIGLVSLTTGKLPNSYVRLTEERVSDDEIKQLVTMLHLDTTQIQRVSMSFSDIPDRDMRKDRMDIIVDETK